MDSPASWAATRSSLQRIVKSRRSASFCVSFPSIAAISSSRCLSTWSCASNSDRRFWLRCAPTALICFCPASFPPASAPPSRRAALPDLAVDFLDLASQAQPLGRPPSRRVCRPRPRRNGRCARRWLRWMSAWRRWLMASRSGSRDRSRAPCPRCCGREAQQARAASSSSSSPSSVTAAKIR